MSEVPLYPYDGLAGGNQVLSLNEAVHAQGCEDRTQDGPASGEKGSNVGPLARLYSG